MRSIRADLLTLVGDLGDDNAVVDALAFFGHFLDVGPAAQDDPAFPRAVGGLDAFSSNDDSAGGEIRPRDEFHQGFERDLVHPVVIVDQVDQGCGQLFQVVRWNVGGHADRDTG